MPFTLDTPKPVNATVAKYEINAFSIDLDRVEIHVSYYELDDEGARLGEKLKTISGPDFPTAINEANTIAGADVYGAIKAALYGRIQTMTGVTGTID